MLRLENVCFYRDNKDKFIMENVKILDKKGVIASSDGLDVADKKAYNVPDYFVVDSEDETRNNIWNMAKDIVSEGGTKEVTDPQIDKKCNELLKVNGLKYPSDTCDVVKVVDGQKIFTSEAGLNRYNKD